MATRASLWQKTKASTRQEAQVENHLFHFEAMPNHSQAQALRQPLEYRYGSKRMSRGGQREEAQCNMLYTLFFSLPKPSVDEQVFRYQVWTNTCGES